MVGNLIYITSIYFEGNSLSIHFFLSNFIVGIKPKLLLEMVLALKLHYRYLLILTGSTNQLYEPSLFSFVFLKNIN